MPYRYRRYIDLGTLDDIIPQDYVHVFLIRNPLKAIPSMFRLMQLLKAVPEGKNEPFVHLIRKEMKVLNSHMVWNQQLWLSTTTTDMYGFVCMKVHQNYSAETHLFLHSCAWIQDIRMVHSLFALWLYCRRGRSRGFEKRRRVFDWPGASLVEMQRLHQWVVQTKGYKPLIIDADDLQRDPGWLISWIWCSLQCFSLPILLLHGELKMCLDSKRNIQRIMYFGDFL